MYTLRQGKTPISGASDEISWTRCTEGKMRSGLDLLKCRLVVSG